jgi:hypothetical protein
MAEMFSYEELCTPAKIYIVLSIFSLLLGLLNKMPLSVIVFKLFFILLWTWILNYLCDKGFETVSWIIVFLPFIVMASAFVFMTSFGTKPRRK